MNQTNPDKICTLNILCMPIGISVPMPTLVFYAYLDDTKLFVVNSWCFKDSYNLYL